ncbi:hypothetical protein BDV32DRAFT_25268 [Aspergillus pseudonomiae]|nr:hypothetical protein BDV32DRAFT_25268 [Aspergillus pseudonomiae]
MEPMASAPIVVLHYSLLSTGCMHVIIVSCSVEPLVSMEDRTCQRDCYCNKSAVVDESQSSPQSDGSISRCTVPECRFIFHQIPSTFGPSSPRGVEVKPCIRCQVQPFSTSCQRTRVSPLNGPILQSCLGTHVDHFSLFFFLSLEFSYRSRLYQSVRYRELEIIAAMMPSPKDI